MLLYIGYTHVSKNTNARILKAHSHALALNEWRFNLSFSWVSMLFLNSWMVSVVPYYVTNHPPANQKQHLQSREAQIEVLNLHSLSVSELLEYGRKTLRVKPVFHFKRTVPKRIKNVFKFH
jgi:hypothetical protein